MYVYLSFRNIYNVCSMVYKEKSAAYSKLLSSSKTKSKKHEMPQHNQISL